MYVCVCVYVFYVWWVSNTQHISSRTRSLYVVSSEEHFHLDAVFFLACSTSVSLSLSLLFLCVMWWMRQRQALSILSYLLTPAFVILVGLSSHTGTIALLSSLLPPPRAQTTLLMQYSIAIFCRHSVLTLLWWDLAPDAGQARPLPHSPHKPARTNQTDRFFQIFHFTHAMQHFIVG